MEIRIRQANEPGNIGSVIIREPEFGEILLLDSDVDHLRIDQHTVAIENQGIAICKNHPEA